MASSRESDPAAAIGAHYRAQIDDGGEGAVVTTVVEAIAAVRGVEPVDVDFRLDESVDTDALEGLYRHARRRPERTLRVEFEVDGLVVGVHSDGLVTIA